MKKHKCTLCGFTYDPEKGQLATGVHSGTQWEDIPDDWTCPVCGASKNDFEPVD